MTANWEKKFSKSAWEQAKQQAVKAYPEEACGLFFENTTDGQMDVFKPVRNIQNELHQNDSARFPRTAATAYQMDPLEVQRLENEFAKTHVIRGIFHSHIDAGAYFSIEDRQMACPWGEPLFADRFYLIFGVHAGSVTEAALFTWQKDSGDFLKTDLKEILECL